MYEQVGLWLDQETITRLQRLAERLGRSFEDVVRDALLIYEASLELAVAQDAYVNG